jgi:hypothetical protein
MGRVVAALIRVEILLTQHNKHGASGSAAAFDMGQHACPGKPEH